MKLLNLNAILILWLREMKRFLRARSRIFGTLAIPILSIVFFNMGLSAVELPGIPKEVDYINFLTPGIIGATILFSSMFSGISVLWDKEFGFLKEILITPVSRLSIFIGRVAGSATISLVQGTLILGIALLILRFKKPSLGGIAFAILFMLLIAIVFIGLGLILASRMSDIQGFNVMMGFIIYPLFLLSGSIVPLQRLPKPFYYAAYLNPLMYGVDGLRASLVKFSLFPKTFDLIVLSGIALAVIIVGALFFEREEA